MSDDERLSALLADAVSDVEPEERLAEIRRRTRVVDLAARRRRRWLAGGGAVLAVAGTVTAVALVGTPGTPDARPIPPAATPSSPAVPTPTSPAVPTPVTPTEPTSPGATVAPSVAGAVYYVGSGPRGPRLFREFQAFPADGDLASLTVAAAVSGEPLDPDYTSPWFDHGAPEVRVSRERDVVVVDLLTDEPVLERPADMSAEEASLAVEQILYTVQAAVQERAPVQLRLNGGPAYSVFGVPTGEPLAEGSATEVLSLMSISSPGEGQVVSDAFVASGVNNAFEATYGWELRRGGEDGAVVREGFGTAAGCCEDRLFAWETDPIDLTGLEPGEYTFVARNDDPSGGEGGGPDIDTRTVVIE